MWENQITSKNWGSIATVNPERRFSYQFQQTPCSANWTSNGVILLARGWSLGTTSDQQSCVQALRLVLSQLSRIHKLHDRKVFINDCKCYNGNNSPSSVEIISLLVTEQILIKRTAITSTILIDLKSAEAWACLSCCAPDRQTTRAADWDRQQTDYPTTFNYHTIFSPFPSVTTHELWTSVRCPTRSKLF